LAQLLAPPGFQAPQISPDGEYISYIALHNGVTNLFVAPVGNIADYRPVTDYRDSGVRAGNAHGAVMYRWHYDSRNLLYPRDYEGDENWDIHIVNILDGTRRNLTPVPGKQVELIAYGREQPDQALVSIGSFSKEDTTVHRLDMSSGVIELVQANEGFTQFFADENLRVRLAGRLTDSGGFDFQRLDGNAGSAPIYGVKPEDMHALLSAMYQGIIRFDAEGKRVFLYDATGRDTAALIDLDLHTGKTNVLAHDERVDIGGVLYHPTSHRVQAYATNWTRNRWHALDDEIKQDFAALDRAADGDWEIISRSDDDGRWIVAYTMSDEPVAYYLYERPSRRVTRLFSSTPQLEGLGLSRMHPYVFTTDDGFELVSYILLPPGTDPDDNGRPDRPLPTVVYVHGGPSDERASFGFGAFPHWLANRGYVFQYVNFRGSAGFGKAFHNAQKMEWGGKMHKDVVDQVVWAIDEGISDPSRVGILGGSYGGYETLIAMTKSPEIFACGVDIVGPSDLETFQPLWDEDQMGKDQADAGDAEAIKFLRSRSPVNYAHRVRGQLLIGQGANDSWVPMEQSDRMVENLVAGGAKVTYVIYPDEGHGFMKPANSLSFFALTEAFFAQCLGGRSEPIGYALNGSSIQVPVGKEHIPGLAAALVKNTGDSDP